MLWKRVPKQARRLIVVNGVMLVGYGLALPYTSIFLADRTTIGSVALYFGAAGLSNIVVAGVLATVRNANHRGVAAAGGVCSVIGYLSFPAIRTSEWAVALGVVNGAGQALFVTMVMPILATLTDESERRATFAFRNQVVNASLASGSVVGGLFVGSWGKVVIPYLFIATAAAHLPILWYLSQRVQDMRPPEHDDREPIPSRQAPITRATLRLLAAPVAFNFAVSILVFSQLETSVPLVVDRLSDLDVGWVPVILAVNLATIVFLQGPLTGVLDRYGEVVGLRTAVALWVVALGLAAVTAPGPPTMVLVGLIGCSFVLGLGECAHSCSYTPWLMGRVPERQFRAASAVDNTAVGMGYLLGPTVAVGVLSLGSALLVWVVLMGATALTTLLTVNWPARRRVADATPGPKSRS